MPFHLRSCEGNSLSLLPYEHLNKLLIVLFMNLAFCASIFFIYLFLNHYLNFYKLNAVHSSFYNQITFSKKSFPIYIPMIFITPNFLTRVVIKVLVYYTNFTYYFDISLLIGPIKIHFS